MAGTHLCILHQQRVVMTRWSIRWHWAFTMDRHVGGAKCSSVCMSVSVLMANCLYGHKCMSVVILLGWKHYNELDVGGASLLSIFTELNSLINCCLRTAFKKKKKKKKKEISYCEVVWGSSFKVLLGCNHTSFGIDFESPVTTPCLDTVVNVCIVSLILIWSQNSVKWNVVGPRRHLRYPDPVGTFSEVRSVIVDIRHRHDHSGCRGEWRCSIVTDSHLQIKNKYYHYQLCSICSFLDIHALYTINNPSTSD